jgi:heterodisulfide reductase subunit A
MTPRKRNDNGVLVLGGGITGIQAALDLANSRTKVYLVEKSPSLGGRMAQLDKTWTVPYEFSVRVCWMPVGIPTLRS